MPIGRFAPSPTGRLHLGNLRTALVAWLAARSDGSDLYLRFDDLDRGAVREDHYRTQATDLQALGLDWDGDPISQRDRLDRYRDAIQDLVAADLVYHCYCSRREIREAAQAPNRPLAGHRYPGTCRDLTAARQRDREATGRPAALRLRAEETTGASAGNGAAGPVDTIGFTDRVAGEVGYDVDDFVVQRNDGTPAYHLVTVVDDADLGIELVVRADDLLDSTSRQLLVGRLLALPAPDHAHVPLVLGPNGERLAKRHGAVTLEDREVRGESPAEVLSFLAASLELCEPGERVVAADLVARFDLAQLPTEPLVLDETFLADAVLGDASLGSEDAPREW